MAKKKTTVRKRTGRQSGSAKKHHQRLAMTAKPKNLGASDARRVEATLKRFQRAFKVTMARGEDVLAVSRSLGDVAVQKYTLALIRDLYEKQFLRDLLALRDALGEVPTGTLNPRLESLRLLPDALIQWLGDRFDLVPFGRTGEELELAAGKLTNFSCDFDQPPDLTILVRVQVIAPGWKRGNKPLIPPRVKLIQPAALPS